MSKLPAIPNVASPLPADLRQWVDAVTARLNASNADNPKGSGLDASVTFRDMTNTTGMKVTVIQTAQTNVKPTLHITP